MTDSLSPETLASLRKLTWQWHDDQTRYPDHLGGQLAAAAVRCCARELENVLSGRDRHDSPHSTGLVDELVQDREPGEALKLVRAVLALEGGS